MRITNKSLITNFLSDLNNIMDKFEEKQRQISTGKKIVYPSDDPLLTSKALFYESRQTSLVQYERLIDQHKSKLQQTEANISKINDMLKRIRELSIRGANDSLTIEDKKMIADEIDQILQGLVDIANTTVEGRYIFGGTLTDKPPFKVIKDFDPELAKYGVTEEKILKVVYTGNDYIREGDVSENSRVQTSFTGEDIFQKGSNWQIKSATFFKTKDQPIGINSGDLFLKVGNEKKRVFFDKNMSLEDIAYRLNTSGLPIRANIEEEEGKGYRLVIQSYGQPIEVEKGEYPSNLFEKLKMQSTLTVDLKMSDAAVKMPLSHVFKQIQDGAFMVQGEYIEYTKFDSMQEIINKINAIDGVKAEVKNGKLEITSLGATNLRVLRGNLFDNLHLYTQRLYGNSVGTEYTRTTLKNIGVNKGFFKVDNQTIPLTGDETIYELVDKLNNSSLPVVARIEGGQLYLYRDDDKDGQPDPNSSLTLQDVSELDSFLIQRLGFTEVKDRYIDQSSTDKVSVALASDPKKTAPLLYKTMGDLGVPSAGASISINGYSVMVYAKDSLNDLADRINSTAGLKDKVYARVTDTGRLELYSDEQIKVTQTDFTEKLGLTNQTQSMRTDITGEYRSYGVEEKKRSIFDIIIDIRDALIRGDSDLISQGNYEGEQLGDESTPRTKPLLQALDEGMENLRKQWSKLGAQMNSLNFNDSMNKDLQTTTETIISDIEDVDLTEAISQLNLINTALKVSLSSAAKILPQSLADYIR